jgi:hypothetical protein
MLATKSSPFISSPLREAVSTGVATEEPITRDYGRKDRAREKWQNLIDYQLIEWGRDPSQLADDDIQPPSKRTIQQAIWLADALSKFDAPAPTRIVPDAHGGIVFERREGNVFESIRLSADGSAEYCAFENSRLVERQPWVSKSADSE